MLLANATYMFYCMYIILKCKQSLCSFILTYKDRSQFIKCTRTYASVCQIFSFKILKLEWLGTRKNYIFKREKNLVLFVRLKT